MSEFVMLGVAGTFGGALALFLATSVVALPILAVEKARGRAKTHRRR